MKREKLIKGNQLLKRKESKHFRNLTLHVFGTPCIYYIVDLSCYLPAIPGGMPGPLELEEGGLPRGILKMVSSLVFLVSGEQHAERGRLAGR
jgi:hypothetical protein